MADEARIIELFDGGRPIRYGVADATQLEKGTIARLSDPRLVIAHTGIDQPIVGIVAEEKLANDGSNFVSIYTDGIFDMRARAALGACALGKQCAGSGTANRIWLANADDFLQGSDIGMCLEDTADDEYAAVRVNK